LQNQEKPLINRKVKKRKRQAEISLPLFLPDGHYAAPERKTDIPFSITVSVHFWLALSSN
jgi:hypothetical protein